MFVFEHADGRQAGRQAGRKAGRQEGRQTACGMSQAL